MSITVNINSIDRTNLILFPTLSVKQELSNKVDICNFTIRKNDFYTPSYLDDVKVIDNGNTIFGGTILEFKEQTDSGADTILFKIKATDYTFLMDRIQAAKTYEDKTINYIIDDLLTSYASDFNADNVESDFEVEKIVFNQVPISQCIKKLAAIVQYDWYIDEDKSVHFFPLAENPAPYNLTDTSGNYVYKSLKRKVNGSQLVNVVKVRGGTYEGSSYTDYITVKGDDTKSFQLPYKFHNLAIELDTGSGYVNKTVGIDFIDDFTSKNVLHNYQDMSIRFENALNDGDIIKYTGNPDIRVLAIAEDSDSKIAYGESQKLIRDTSIKSNTIARQRGNAELLAYANLLTDASFYTYNSGLRVGMNITLDSTIRNCDNSFLISSIQFKMIDPYNFGYNIQLITTKRHDLIVLLSKILEPEPLETDESEVSEQIYAINETMKINENVSIVEPENANETMIINEDIRLDEVAPSNVKFVLSSYSPTSISDTKRPGRLDMSMYVY